ncbi:MAG TPA: hypothetical protein VLT59_01480 [Steroidobacteraceae bacterium]|nr:hypothetical protein [Steroidobacteraceae bacterium]
MEPTDRLSRTTRNKTGSLPFTREEELDGARPALREVDTACRAAARIRVIPI